MEEESNSFQNQEATRRAGIAWNRPPLIPRVQRIGNASPCSYLTRGSWKDPIFSLHLFPHRRRYTSPHFRLDSYHLYKFHGPTSRNFSRRKLLPSIVSIHRPLNLLSARRKEIRSCALSPRRRKGEGEVLLMENRLKAVWAKNSPSKLHPSLWTRHNESLERVSTNIKCPVFPLFLRCLWRIFRSRVLEDEAGRAPFALSARCNRFRVSFFFRWNGGIEGAVGWSMLMKCAIFNLHYLLDTWISRSIYIWIVTTAFFNVWSRINDLF